MLIELSGLPKSVQNALSSNTFRTVINQKDGEDLAELMIFQPIGKDPWSGEGVGAGDVATFLSEHRSMPVNVRINSPGGLAFDGITIHNALVQHDAPVNTTVEGIAASAATIIASAARGGGKAKMFENASYFVHRALAMAYGNVDAMAEVSDWLNRIDEQIARTYAARTVKRYDQMLSVMRGSGKNDGTVMTAQEAKAAGFIDEIVSVKNAAKNDSDLAKTVQQQQADLLAAELKQREADSIRTRLKLLELDEVNS